MGRREREPGLSRDVALCVLMAQQPRGSAMGARPVRAVGSSRGLWAGEATDSRVCSPHAVSNRGIFVCKAVLTLFLHAAACIRSLCCRGALGAPSTNAACSGGAALHPSVLFAPWDVLCPPAQLPGAAWTQEHSLG